MGEGMEEDASKLKRGLFSSSFPFKRYSPRGHPSNCKLFQPLNKVEHVNVFF